jgi:predicted outer membrane repeat protein
MDANHFDFDHLTKALSTPDIRRRVVTLLASLPLVTGLSSLLGEEESSASGRRKQRRKQDHHRHDQLSAEKKRKNKRKKRKNKKKCKPQSSDQTCDGRCGTVTNNCKKAVDCGSCGCTQHSDCGADALCLDDGSCQACTVTCPGGACTEAALQEALTAGGTIYVCPGRYTGTFNALTNATIIGAGDGTDEASDTILDAQDTGRVFVNAGENSTLARLRITGGFGEIFGAGLYHLGGTLTMTDCTIAGNQNSLQGAGIYNQGSSQSSSLNMTRCVVTGNNSGKSGGGIFSTSTLNMTSCQITGNEAGEAGGGIYAGSGAVKLDACTVTGNHAGSSGGGVIGALGTVTLVNGATITNNTPNNCAGSVPGCMN